MKGFAKILCVNDEVLRFFVISISSFISKLSELLIIWTNHQHFKLGEEVADVPLQMSAHFAESGARDMHATHRIAPHIHERINKLYIRYQL
jgi:hypothetical protein